MTPVKARWIVLATMAALLLAAVGAVLWARPEQGSTFLDKVDARDSVAIAMVALDGVNPNRGTATLRLGTSQGELPLPDAGATLITDIAGLGPIRLPHTELSSEVSTETLLDAGNLGDYPFDSYPLTITMVLIEGDATTMSDAELVAAPRLPLAVIAASLLSGFSASVDGKQEADEVKMVFTIERPNPAVVWAVAMMAIFWLLAIGAAGVVAAILVGLRPFETRHLAWLTALLFAFAAFRGTAPGSPPIGVFLDFGAFFWAVGVIVVAELVLLGCYLMSERGRPS